MYFYDDKKHSRPHIHAEYGEHEASIAIDDGEVLGGTFPPSKIEAGAGVDRNTPRRPDGQLEVGSRGRTCFQNSPSALANR